MAYFSLTWAWCYNYKLFSFGWTGPHRRLIQDAAESKIKENKHAFSHKNVENHHDTQTHHAVYDKWISFVYALVSLNFPCFDQPDAPIFPSNWLADGPLEEGEGKLIWILYAKLGPNPKKSLISFGRQSRDGAWARALLAGWCGKMSNNNDHHRRCRRRLHLHLGLGNNKRNNKRQVISAHLRSIIP